MSRDVDQQAADVIGAQAGRIAALIEAVRALIESHPDPAAFRAQFMEQVSNSPLASLTPDVTAPMLRGHREIINYLTEAIGAATSRQAEQAMRERMRRAH